MPRKFFMPRDSKQGEVFPGNRVASGLLRRRTPHGIDERPGQIGRIISQITATEVGRPGGIAWSSPWHDIVHDWHRRVDGITSRIGIETWSAQCLRHDWKFAHYAANLPASRWIMRALHWHPEGQRPGGAPQHTWEYKLVAYCRWTGRADWKAFAADSHGW